MAKRVLIFKNGDVVDEYRSFMDGTWNCHGSSGKTSYMHEISAIIKDTFRNYKFTLISLFDYGKTIRTNGNIIRTVPFNIKNYYSKLMSFCRFLLLFVIYSIKSSVSLIISDGILLVILVSLGIIMSNDVVPVIVNPFLRRSRITRFILNRTPVIFARSKFIKRQLISMGVKSKILVYLPHYGDYFYEVDKQKFEKLFKPEDFNLVFIGRFVKAKGIYVLLDIAKQLRAYEKIKFFIVGDGPEETAMKDIVTKHGLDNVIFLGYVNHQNLYAVLRNADVTLIPSYKEGLNKVVLESIISGVPVIGSNTGGITDWVIPDKTGYLVEPGYIEGFVDKILFFYENSGNIKDMKNRMSDYKKYLLHSDLTLNRLFKLHYG